MDQIASVDNTRWVEDNKHILDPNNVQATFAVVRKTHPRAGAAYDVLSLEMIRDKLKDMTVEDIAKYADAVTICCYEVLGNDNEPPQTDKQSLNTTALGNSAYIALYHSKEEVRKKYADFVNKSK